ncbi:MAG: AcrR family transcriptional regulator [Gammaproteobacteria bacterium]|jgi:AcrR family transcriptional regulator
MVESASENKRDRKESILDAAESLFSQHSFAGVTMRQIANLAGFGVALPNYYFKSKLGLFKDVFCEERKF